jgi:hypothetical protein
MNKGFVIMAQNTKTTDYVHCAEVLRDSILRQMPDSSVTIITSEMLPYGDTGGFTNDWQVYECSPYEYTIKLEADLFIPQSIEHWWEVLKDRDLAVCSTIRNYKNEISTVKAYRQLITDSKLPDVYNAITYFKKSKLAQDFFNTVKDIFQNWEEYRKFLRCNVNEDATTDWVYAIACHILGEENTTIDFPAMSMVHMKQLINNLMTENWTKELICEYTNPIKIQTFPQQYPFHYHVKEFSQELRKHYG